MKQARFKGWRRGSLPQGLGASGKCDLVRQGRSFKCSDLALPPNQICSYCQQHQPKE